VDQPGQRIRVEKVRLQTRHLKPGRAGAEQGGIVEDEGYVNLSNVMLVNPADDKPSRIRIEERDGKKVRVFARGGQVIPDPASA
jgi:large subunit ribosomal protein L24